MHGIKGVRVGSIAGITIKLDWSVLVIFWLFTWSLASSLLPEVASGYSGGEYWLAAVVTTVFFFASLLAHELSHCFAARKRGIEVRDITLWMLGGVSSIEQDPATPSDDLHIALAGPEASFVIGVGGLVAAAVLAGLGAPNLVAGCAAWLGFVNLVLGVFNLAPAAPLDGGRVLRAWRWRKTGDRTRAAIDATRAGRVFAFVLMGLGFAEFLVGADVSGLWLVLLGWFLLAASRVEENQVRMLRDLAGVRVRDVMTADPITVADTMSVDEVLHDYVLARHCSSFPMLTVDGRLVGLVTLTRLRSVHVDRRATTRAAEVVWPLSELTVAAPDEPLLDVLRRAGTAGDGRIVVCREGVLVGIVSPSDITRAVQFAELVRMP